MENFLYLSKQELSPQYYTVRLIPAVYSGGKLPDGLSLDEAAEFVANLIKEKWLVPIKEEWISPLPLVKRKIASLINKSDNYLSKPENKFV